jgi:hypothetical protein
MIKDRIPDCVKPSIGDGDVRSNQTEPVACDMRKHLLAC